MSGLCVTKLDVLDGVETLRVGVGYKVDGETRDILPVGAEVLADCEPIYEEMPGWRESTVGVKRFDELPLKRAQLPEAHGSSLRRADRHDLDRTGSRRDDRAAASVRVNERLRQIRGPRRKARPRNAVCRYCWCPEEDSNLHSVARQDLNLVRLPIPPSGHEGAEFYDGMSSH